MSERFLETFQLLVLLSEGHLATRMCPLSPNSFISWLGMGPLEAKLSRLGEVGGCLGPQFAQLLKYC